MGGETPRGRLSSPSPLFFHGFQVQAPLQGHPLVGFPREVSRSGRKAAMKGAYTILRSSRRRRSISLSIDAQGRLLVRAPQRVSLGEIERVVGEREEWVRKRIEEMREERTRWLPVEEGSPVLLFPALWGRWPGHALPGFRQRLAEYARIRFNGVEKRGCRHGEGSPRVLAPLLEGLPGRFFWGCLMRGPWSAIVSLGARG